MATPLDPGPDDARPTQPHDPDDYVTLDRLRPGRQAFGRYTLEAIAGRGGMGVVWRAQDPKLERTIALKFLPPEVAADPEALRELKRETKRCLDLTHPHIVRVHDFVEDAASSAIAMEFIEGQSLARRKAAAPLGCLSVEELTPLVPQLCAALDYAHREARIVHRDLKPANILATTDGRTKITDFGIARSLTETRTRLTGSVGGTSGTLLYMSPQQLLNRPHTPADDIYSLGATLYELLTGKPPFFSGDLAHLIQQVHPTPLAERRAELGNDGPPIPAVWEETILACLAKEPADRPATAGEVWDRLQGRGPVAKAKDRHAEAPEPHGSRDLIPPQHGLAASSASVPSARSRSRLPLLASAALVAVVLAVLAAYFAMRPSPGPARATPMVEKASTPTPANVSPAAAPALPREFAVTVDPADAGAHLWLGPVSDVTVPDGGRAVIKDLPDGEHELVVQAPGYQPLTTRVVVKDGRGSAEARLVPVRGALRLAARPGTVVTAVDARGRTTQLGTVPADGRLAVDNLLTIGAYTVKFAHPDLAAAELPAGLTLGRPLALEPPQQPLPGELRIFSVPTGAEVSVNGQKLGTTPATLARQPSETALAVEVFARGYRRTAETVTLKPREVRTLNVGTLVAESGAMNFRFSSFDARLGQPEVSVDGKLVDAARPLEGLEVGRHVVAVAHRDYEPWQQEVSVRDQATSLVEVKLVPKPARLALRANVSPLLLTVNGRGVQPGEIRDGVLVLPAGAAHTVVASAPGHKPATRTFTLSPNGQEQWEIALEKQTYPQPGQPFENTLGQKFVPVPGTNVLFCIWETRVQDFEVFVRETNYDATSGAITMDANGRRIQRGGSWRNMGFAQTGLHPVGCISQADAEAFCRWLTEKERRDGRLAADQEYRLPTDAEWDAAVGKDEFPWGSQWPPPHDGGNYADATAKRRWPSWSMIDGSDDGYAGTAPVGSFAANRHGLYDLGGNLWERVGDRLHGLRGASFDGGGRDSLASSARGSKVDRVNGIGFRVVCAVGAAR